MYAVSWKLLILGQLSEYFPTLLKRLYLKKIAAKCSIFLHQLYLFHMGRSVMFCGGDKAQISSGEGKRKGGVRGGMGGEAQIEVFAKFPLL